MEKVNTNQEYEANNSSQPTTSTSQARKSFSPASYIRVLRRDCRHFMVLMWKHLVVRKRKFIVTFVELLSPCIFFALMILFKPLLNVEDDGAKSTNNKTLLRSHEMSIKNMMPPQLVLYSPATLLTAKLMDRAGSKMGLARLLVFPDIRSRGYYAIPEESLLYINDLVQKMTDDSAIVIFQDLDEEECPQTLNYTIRMKRDLTSEEDADPQVKGAMSEPLLRLQWSIDSSFLAICRNQVEKRATTKLPVVALSEFPLSDEREISVISLICDFFRTLCPLSLLLPFVYLLNRLIQERCSGVQELIKQVGVSYDVWAMSHSFNTILTGLFYSVCGTIVCKVTSKPYIPNTNAFLLFLLFELHFHSTMTFAFLCSYISKSGEYSTTLAVVVFVLSTAPARLLEREQLPRIVQPLTGIIPHVPVLWFWWEVQTLEIKGRGLHFKDIRKHHSKYSQSVMMAYLSMSLQIIAFFIVGGYFNSVCPGKYGTRKPWNYIFKRKEYVSPTALQETQEEMRQKDKRYFEDSQLTDVGIKIDNVTKIYGKNIVLSNVSFHVYQGEITVLLGHNGAGKTTLMSIITAAINQTLIFGYKSSFPGMLPLTSGKVYVNGMDISQEQTKVQTAIGMCPQHHLFVPNLSVMEHVIFFTMLKGVPYKEAKKSSKTILMKLGIIDKGNNKVDQLSGGMKKRLQLACALSGGSNVVILDEPTSGLDVETRRELWDLLLSLRGERTVLLSTHFMEEADALGDRVTALHAGRLHCHASPMYLKKNIGTGYRLSLTTTRLPQVQRITALVQSVIPTATIKESSYNTISYNLPSQESDKFPQLFSRLEKKKPRFEIMSIGVGVSSLEEVFLKLCSDIDTKFTQEVEDIGLPEIQYPKIYGYALYGRQMCVLMRRHFRFLMVRKYTFLILEILLPLAILIFWSWNLREGEKKKQSEPKKLSAMNLDVYGDKSEKAVLLRVDNAEAMRAVKGLAKHHSNVEFQLTGDFGEKLFRSMEVDRSRNMDSTELNKYVIGIEVSDSKAKVMYNSMVRHAAPIALNLLSNILAAQYILRADGKTITTNYQPLDGSFLPQKDEKDVMLLFPKSLTACVMWIGVLIIVVMTSVTNSVALPIKERETGSRHIHMMSGCPPAVHWLTTFLVHTVLYTSMVLAPVTLTSLLDAESTLNKSYFMGSLLQILILGSMAYLQFCYLVSFSFSRAGSELLLSHLIIFTGVVPAVILFAAQVSRTKLAIWCKIPCNFFYYVFPVATLTMAALKAANVARLNAFCNRNSQMCRHILVFVFKMLPTSAETRGFDPDRCCIFNRGKKCTMCFSEYAPGNELVILIVQTAVYGMLVILTQYGVFNGLHDRIFNKRYKPKPDNFTDRYVEIEKSYVSHQMRKPLNELNEESDAMLVNNLHKYYFSICKKSCNAVKGVSFSVKKGECFGVLGVNGAGKSTMFKMITGVEVATRGKIYANGQLLKWPCRSKYLHSLGYCPQFLGLDEFQSGHDNLATLLAMRGLHADDIITQAKKWIEIVGLEKYRDVLVVDYSGGCMRRLATATALSSGASVTLLDEPTSGVDVSARRRVWLALRNGLRQNRAVIITSHSIDEMEALCDRIAILSAGEMCALGSAPALRAAYAAGHALSIKLKSAGIKNNQKLKDALSEKFNCTLKDDRITMLLYHINETMQYSNIFTLLEELKEKFPDLIEDYSVTETTLEEVFLSFAQPAPSDGHEQSKSEHKRKNNDKSS